MQPRGSAHGGGRGSHASQLKSALLKRFGLLGSGFQGPKRRLAAQAPKPTTPRDSLPKQSRIYQIVWGSPRTKPSFFSSLRRLCPSAICTGTFQLGVFLRGL